MQENSIWLDEIYTLSLTLHNPLRIIDLAGIDAHPPGYYLALRLWLQGFRQIGIEPGIGLARGLNIAAWVLLTILLWRVCRQFLGKHMGTLLTWAVSAGALFATAINQLRSYGLALAALCACFVIFLRIYQIAQENPEPRKRIMVYWGAYAVLASLALWTHLQSALVLLCMGMIWLVVGVSWGRWRSTFFLGGLIAQAVAVLSFSPWLVRVPSQMEYLATVNTQWMTPPSIANLLRVFVFWYPFGVPLNPEESLGRGAMILGALSIAAPAGLALLAMLQTGKRSPDKRALLIAAGGLIVSVAFVLLLWLLNRFGVAKIFHGPRYPLLAVPFWTCGIVGLSVWSISRMGLRPAWNWLVIAPWFICAAIGNVYNAWHENRSNLLDSLFEGREDLPKSGEAIFVIPEGFIPFWSKSLKPFNVQPFGKIADLASVTDTWVLSLNNRWEKQRRTNDRWQLEIVESGKIADYVKRYPIPPVSKPEFLLFQLIKIRPSEIRQILAKGVNPLTVSKIPEAAVAVALPEDQFFFDGWSVVEGDLLEGSFRWGIGAASKVRFDRVVRPGSYLLHYEGFRTSHPTEQVEMIFRINGEDQTYRISRNAGELAVTIQVEITRKKRPVLVVEHPVWRPSDYGSGDTRELSHILWFAWIEPVTNGTSITSIGEVGVLQKGS